MSRVTRGAAVAALLLSTSVAGLVGAGPAAAVTTSGWATWTPITGTSNDYATTMQLPAGGFPRAVVASDSRGDVQLPSGNSTFLGGTSDSVPTAVGVKYGSSRGQRYLNLRPKADNAASPSTTTFTFDSPTPAAGWTFVLGDIDADQVQIGAKAADGTPLTHTQLDAWKTGHDTFNYAGATDRPTWDPATSTLVGNPGAIDTNGASAWFEPDVSISSLTFVFTRRAGFPIYQVWFASQARTISGTVTDASVGGGSCPLADATVHLVGPDGAELASTHPDSGGAYSFGQFAMQDGYTVAIDRPDGCAVVGPDSKPVSTAGGDATATFALRQVIPFAVSGTVRTSDGTPVPGATITLTPPGGGTVKTVTTDADGTYLIDNNLAVDGYTVSVTAPDGYSVVGAGSHAVDLSAGSVIQQDFELAERPSVSGTVSGGGGPLGGVTVTLTPPGGGTPTTTVTLGDGTYTFDHVPPGNYSISVTAPDGYRTPLSRDGVAVAADDVTGMDFILTRPGAIGGEVMTSGGDPVPAATVTIDGPGGSQPVTTDAAGQFFTGGLDSGDYTITLTVPSGFTAHSARTRHVTITDEGEVRGGQDFTIARSTATTPPPSGSSPPGSSGSGSGSASGSVPPSGASTAPIAATGYAPLRPVGIGIALLIAGALAILAGRRRAAPPRAH